jgi:hypothetical protein
MEPGLRMIAPSRRHLLGERDAREHLVRPAVVDLLVDARMIESVYQEQKKIPSSCRRSVRQNLQKGTVGALRPSWTKKTLVSRPRGSGA